MLPSLAHFTYRDYDSFYEPAEDSYLLIDALTEDITSLVTAFTAPVVVELGYGIICSVCKLLACSIDMYRQHSQCFHIA